MFRGSLVLATLLEVAQSQQPPTFPPPCQDCSFDLRAFEEFSVDYHSVQITDETYGPEQSTITTGPLPDTFPSEHGTIAVHARNLQLKLDNQVSFPSPFSLGALQLSGIQIHEELHINGATGQASFHLASPIVNLCFLLDGLPPVAQMEHDNIEQHLQQAEQYTAQTWLPMFQHATVDGEVDQGPFNPYLPRPFRVLLTQSSHPALIPLHQTRHLPEFDPREQDMYRHFNPQPSPDLPGRLATKFDNYADSVGDDEFSVRACGITDQSSTQSLLAANLEARSFILNRISQHQRRLESLLHPIGLSTRLNFFPREIAELMVPAVQQCPTDELAQMPGTAFSTLQAVAFSVCSFVMGVSVTFAAFRKKTATREDAYYQVVA